MKNGLDDKEEEYRLEKEYYWRVECLQECLLWYSILKSKRKFQYYRVEDASGDH